MLFPALESVYLQEVPAVFKWLECSTPQESLSQARGRESAAAALRHARRGFSPSKQCGTSARICNRSCGTSLPRHSRDGCETARCSTLNIRPQLRDSQCRHKDSGYAARCRLLPALYTAVFPGRGPAALIVNKWLFPPTSHRRDGR